MPGRTSGSAMIPFRWLGACGYVLVAERTCSRFARNVKRFAQRLRASGRRTIGRPRWRPRGGDHDKTGVCAGSPMGQRWAAGGYQSRAILRPPPPARHPNVARDAAAAATDDRNALPLRPPVTSAPQCRREARDGTLGRFPGDEPTALWRSRARRWPPTGRSTALVRLAQQGQVTPAHGISSRPMDKWLKRRQGGLDSRRDDDSCGRGLRSLGRSDAGGEGRASSPLRGESREGLIQPTRAEGLLNDVRHAKPPGRLTFSWPGMARDDHYDQVRI